MTGIIPVLFRNPFPSFWVVFIIIEGLGNYIWIRRVVHRKPAASKPQNQETLPENITDTAMKENESIQYIDLGLPSGTLWADRNAGAEGVYKLGTLCDKASAPGKLPTYDQCEELIKVCDFSSCLVPDENDIMRNFIKVEGSNKNAIFFPCVRPDAEESEIGAYCWCADDSDEYSYFMLLQQRLLGLLDFAEISNLTIGMTLKSGKLMVRNVKGA